MTFQATPKTMIHRPTAIGAALLDAAVKAGLDVGQVRLPLRHEPSWTVTRRGPRDKKRGRR